MKNQYIRTFLVTAAFTVFASANAMIMQFNGNNGRLIREEVTNPALVNFGASEYINHLDDINGSGADVQVLENGQRGVIVLYLTWHPQTKNLRGF